MKGIGFIVTFKVFNTLGQLVMSGDLGAGLSHHSLATLSVGNYLMQIEQNDEIISNQKLIKE